MSKQLKEKNKNLHKLDEANLKKIKVVFKKSILKKILLMLTMEHSGFRTIKSIRNINRLFNNIDLNKYSNSKELESYIWCISYFSKQWIDGIIDPDIIWEGAKRHKDYDSIKEGIINSSINDKNIISSPEAKMIFELIAEALQFGYLNTLKEEYNELLDEINLDKPGSFRELANRLFMVSESVLDIKHNTNMVANNVTFNTADMDSIKESIHKTIESLSSKTNAFKTGIKRLNTLLSPAYMNGRVYTYIGLPGSGKSLMLLKTALDIRKYNKEYIPKIQGMKPAVLYISMENTFTETIERIWNMTFDDSITNYHQEEAMEMLCNELGISNIIYEDKEVAILDSLPTETNIELIIKCFSYREISTTDIFTLIQDLKEENFETCALILDYIKRIRPDVPTPDNEKMELNKIINELKALAMIIDIPVITAHQMNRAAATIVDSAARQGKGDVTALVGREHVGSAWEIIETSDWAAVLNIEFKPGTGDKYIVINVVKRRRIDASESDFEKYTYLAHPFAKGNGLRLIDDLNLNKVLSLRSLISDIENVDKEKTNAVPRLKKMEESEFIEFDNDFNDSIL